MRESDNTFETVLKWVVLAVLGIIVLKAALVFLGIAVAFAFRVLPLVLLVWAIVWLVRWLGGNKSTASPATTAGPADVL